MRYSHGNNTFDPSYHNLCIYVPVLVLHFSLDRPAENPRQNVLPAKVEDIVYQGDHTRFWVSIAEDWRVAVTRQHNRFLLDQRRITWDDQVYIAWQADDSFMLEQYREKDEDLLQMPPQNVGEEAPAETANAAAPEQTAVPPDPQVPDEEASSQQ